MPPKHQNIHNNYISSNLNEVEVGATGEEPHKLVKNLLDTAALLCKLQQEFVHCLQLGIHFSDVAVSGANDEVDRPPLSIIGTDSHA